MNNSKPDINRLLELVIGVEAGLDNVSAVISNANVNRETDDTNLEHLRDMLNQVEVEFKEAIEKLEKIVEQRPKRQHEYFWATIWRKFKNWFRRN